MIIVAVKVVLILASLPLAVITIGILTIWALSSRLDDGGEDATK